MDSFDNRLRQILNIFSIDADTGVPDYILTKFLCNITDTLTTSYQGMPDNQNIGDMEEGSYTEAFITQRFSKALSELVKDVKQHASK
jgi:hypothetical protein